ncbi:MAG: heavy metal translocating P-type ATPase [Candidatus Adiutrix sp.]|jgi:Cu2+-exporting ATPase|nr:heavy metal translocating P-type ATPase [Candidatus Adiutrix sp.]
MDGLISSDLRGRMRLRLAAGTMGTDDFKTLRGHLMKIKGVDHCHFSPLTQGLLIVYRAGEELKDRLLVLIGDFQPTGLQEEDWSVRPAAAEKMPPNPVWSHLAKKILPLPVRAVINSFKAVPHILSGLASLFRGRLDVEVLDASALAVCFLRRDFKAAGTLLFFFALSHFLEMWTKRRSRAGLYHSLAGQVEKVWIRAGDGRELLVRESELTEGSLVIVRAGGLIPVDGLVIEGDALVNQASMTGEALPVRRTDGGAVFAGTAVEEGEIVIRATKVGRGTRVQSIVRYIEESEASKSSVQGRAERLADSIVPFSFILSALVFLFTRDPLKAGNVLLVDYSCAIRLSTPLAVLSAMREGNENGLLIKGGRYIEEIAEADTIVFDKTGTLTEAKPRLAAVIPFGAFERREVLRLAACLEEHFPHPVGRAVVRQARAEDLKHEEEHARVDYVVAHGISSTWRERKVVLGSRHFVLEDEHVPLTPEELEAAEAEAAAGRSVLYLAVGGRLAALIVIEDQLRPGVRETLATLRADGLERAIMLTGDIESTAAALARETGFTEYRSHLLPDQKASFVEDLSKNGRRVMMVGDGLNDSAALSRANVGVSMSDSSALAKDVANVLLLNGRLDDLHTARLMSARVMRRINSNYWLIVSLNTVFLGLGLFGLAGPGLTALLHNSTTAWVAYHSTRPFLKPGEKRSPAEKGRPRGGRLRLGEKS